MATDKQKFGYEQTLLYGRYTRDLGTFAKFHARRLKVEKTQLHPGVVPLLESPTRCKRCLRACTVVRDVIFYKLGEDWVFLAILGIIMALLSFCMDFVIEKCQEAKIWLYQECAFSQALQFAAWVSYSVIFILFATGFTHIVSPQAIGSGIPEMKTILRGVILKEYLTFRTLIAKVIGLCSSLGSTLPIGKEGPFVHVASIVATLLSKFVTSFRGIYENESRRSEMLAAAAAVGVACTFAAPIGGVLFSIEVTATYFAVRNYWRGFFAAVCGAIVFRLLALWFKDEETITALFRTNLRTDFPFDALELVAFAAIGIVCGLAGPLFILLHRKIILFTRRRRKMSSFLQKNRFIYPGLVALFISSLTFPPGLGQFFGGELTHRQAINELFSNITWTTGQADDVEDERIISHWKHPDTNIYLNLFLFCIMNFWMGAMSNTLPVPAGIFVPVFTVGAAFGRLVGESMAAWFPAGISSGNIVRQIIPGGYAVVGAAALSGSVTRTISTSVIVFELTGQISHVLPAVLAVLIANAVAHSLQPSFYDSIIKLKRLPYLPDIISAKSRAWNVFVEDIMVTGIHYITFDATYMNLQELLATTTFRSYPLVDSRDSMILLGSVQRFELERLLLIHLNPEQRIVVRSEGDNSQSNATTPVTETSELESEPKEDTPFTVNHVVDTKTMNPRFQVTKVDEEKIVIMPHTLSSDYHAQHSVEGHAPESSFDASMLKSILKSHSNQDINAETESRTTLADDKIHKEESAAKADNIIPSFRIDVHRSSLSRSTPETEMDILDDKKHVQLPPETVKVKLLSMEEQVEWEDEQLEKRIDFTGCQIDPAPFQLVERTSLQKVHSLFSLLGLSHAYVTNTGRMAGVVGLKELRNAIQGHVDRQESEFGYGIRGGHDDDNDYSIELDDPAQLEVEIPQLADRFRIIDSNKEH